jgi:hypothetical protein
MLAVRSASLIYAVFKAPSAVATVGWLTAGMTLPFVAAYNEKYVPFALEKMLIVRKHTTGKIIDGRFGATHGCYCRL